MSMRPLWTIAAMADAMRAIPHGSLPQSVPGCSIDTRTIAHGDAFFAIRGENRDGHDFVSAALEAGAGLAVVAERELGRMPEGAPLLAVDDVLAALEDLGRAARARSGARLVAVTGSVGKTSTKEALRLALGAQGETHASVASYNNHWGVPLSLSRMPESAHYGVFELGMNHAGEITPLAKMVRPHVAVITTIEPVHLENLGTIEAIADAKAEIFAGLEPGGAAVLNRDNPQFERLQTAAARAGAETIRSFGRHAAADAQLLDCTLDPHRSLVRARVLGREMTYTVGAPGEHLVFNSLAVILAAASLGASAEEAAAALAQLTQPKGRGAQLTLHVEDGTALLIDESYNANPASMRAALALLGSARTQGRGRRIAVLGDMLELGPTGPELHRALSEPVEQHAVDLVFCAGPLMQSLFDSLPLERRGAYARSSDGLADPLLEDVRAGDAIMIKGSLGSRMGPLVAALSERFAATPSAATAEVNR